MGALLSMRKADTALQLLHNCRALMRTTPNPGADMVSTVTGPLPGERAEDADATSTKSVGTIYANDEMAIAA
jgi:hypothetical protein